MSKITKTYRMNYFDPGANSNKVWIGEAHDNGDFITRFGRVREGANLAVSKKNLGSSLIAESALESKRAEKLKKGYRDTLIFNDETIIENVNSKTDLSIIASRQIGGAAEDETTRKLIEYLAEVNIHTITSATNIRYNAANATFTTPLGVLTPDAVRQARTLLGQIENYNHSNLLDSNIRREYIRDYFQIVPKDFGAKIPDSRELLNTLAKIAQQLSILNALEAAIQTGSATNAEKLFECRLTKIPHWTEDGKQKFREIRALYEKTKNNAHKLVAGLKLTRIYEVEITGMKKDFDATAAKLGNVRADLWHGTKASNLLSILKNGLMIPKLNAAHCTGRMFGNGIYTSLQSSKALNYATGFWNNSGAKKQRTFMFLAEVALGKTNEPKNRTGNFPRKGTDSTWVNPGTCSVINHEAIVYNTNQINLRYLCEFESI